MLLTFAIGLVLGAIAWYLYSPPLITQDYSAATITARGRLEIYRQEREARLLRYHRDLKPVPAASVAIFRWNRAAS